MDRATAVVRSTRSANFYEIPVVSPAGSPDAGPAFASMWGPSSTSAATFNSTSMHRGTHSPSWSDRHASFRKTPLGERAHSSSRTSSSRTSSSNRGVNADEPQFQPAFAFDVNELVSSLRRSASTSSLSSSTGMGNSLLARSASSHGWQSRFTQHSSADSGSSSPFTEQFAATPTALGDSRIQVVPFEPMLATRRGRRDALSGGEHSRTPVHDNQNSIITYSMNRRKKKPIVGMPTSAAPQSPPPQTPTLPGPVASAAAPASRSAAAAVPSNNHSAFSSRTTHILSSSRGSSARPSPPLAPHDLDVRPTTTITTPNGIEYTTEVLTRPTRVTSFYEESFTF